MHDRRLRPTLCRGYNLENTRFNAAERTISRSNVARLSPAWSFTAGGDVSATPTIAGVRVYVPDWGGNLWCLNAANGAQGTSYSFGAGRASCPELADLPLCCCPAGAVIWRQSIISYVLQVDPNPFPGGTYTNSSIISRTSPAISGSRLVLGVMKKGGGCVNQGRASCFNRLPCTPFMLTRCPCICCLHSFPFLLAVSTRDGKLLWGTRLEQHVAALVTQSPVVYAGNVYVGISSLEELIADNPTYKCCTFISSFVKVSASSGKVLWRTYMAPPNGGKPGGFSGECQVLQPPRQNSMCSLGTHGAMLTCGRAVCLYCSGNSIWGSSPAIDKQRNQVYIATGGPARQQQTVLGAHARCTPAARHSGAQPDDQLLRAPCLPLVQATTTRCRTT